MENKHLDVFNELNSQLLSYPRNTLWDEYLKIIVKEQLKQFKYSQIGFEPEKLSRQQIYARAKKIEDSKVDSQTAKNAVNTSKLKANLEAFINSQPDCKKAFLQLNYRPIIIASTSDGGPKNKALIWMDIEAIDEGEVQHEQILKATGVESDGDTEDEYAENLNSITYERKAASEIKPSLFTRLFFNKGELKILSFRGVLLMILLMLSFLLDIFIAIFSLLVILLLNDLPDFKLWQAIIFVAFIPLAYLNWRYFFVPLYRLPYYRVIKAPMFFANINVVNADIEMYWDKDKLNVARVTEFTATCSICSGLIELANGKPDQKQPLVGRCREAPHAHVYSFDRMSMKGCFLGELGYLCDMKV
ncbi:hypothetical protein [Psychrobacter maritimus]|uniref:hypothetical protein n=1 Tax=Psychrobacter maritimus TaxID=256325 RepID=UPI0019195C1E|nr:hypothetical protein [Psychrobacter maritimus]